MPIPYHRAPPQRRSRRRGSPTRTASPRRCRATRSSTATARSPSSAASAGRASTSSSTSGTSTARRCPPGERGEVVLRGPKVFKGYWRDPDATDAAFAGGWFHTGDIGVMDDDGYLYIVDRLKDMIVSGGENIASSEVERVLYEHDAVVEAAVVGRPDDRWGEVPVALRRGRAGRDGDARRAHRALPRPARQVQGPEGRRRSSTRSRGTPRARSSSASSATAAVLDRLIPTAQGQAQVGHEGGRPGHEVGGDGVAATRR